MTRHLNATYRFVQAALLSGLIGFCLMIAGICGPVWIITPANRTSRIEEGIWFSRGCDYSDGACVMSSRGWIYETYGHHGSQSMLSDARWQHIRILSVCALIGCLFGIVSTVVVLVRQQKKGNTSILAAGVVASIFSCITLLLCVLMVYHATRHLDHVPWTKEWSRVVAGVGCIVEFVTSAFMVLAATQSCLRTIKSKQRRSRRMERRQQREAAHNNINNSNILPISTIAGSDSAPMTLAEGMNVRLPAYEEIVINNDNTQPPDYETPPPDYETSELSANNLNSNVDEESGI